MTYLSNGLDVELLDAYNMNPETIVNAARVSYDKEIKEMTEKDYKLLQYLFDHNHTSPLRHSCITFRIQAPVVILMQIYKHHIATSYSSDQQGWNQKSARYTKSKSEQDFYIPEVLYSQSDFNKQSSGSPVVKQSLAFHVFRDSVLKSLDSYQELLELGVSKEQARLALPQCQTSKVIATFGFLSLINFFRLRLSEDSQIETRQIAKVMYQLVKENYFSNIDTMIRT